MTPGHAYRIGTDQGTRIFIAGSLGSKHIHGLVIEADGFHKISIPRNERDRRRVEIDMTPRKVRGHLRRMKAATKGAAKIRRELLNNQESRT